MNVDSSVCISSHDLIVAPIAIPLIMRKVEPNLFYGFRIRKTLENRELWFDVNEFFAWRLLIISGMEAFASIGLYILPGINPGLYALVEMAKIQICIS